MNKSRESITIKRLLILSWYFFKGLFYYSRIIFFKAIDRVVMEITKTPIIKSIDETTKFMIRNKCSVSRYGDGEFDIMMGFDILFQKYSPLLAVRLRRIIKSNQHNHIVCLPDVFKSQDQR